MNATAQASTTEAMNHNLDAATVAGFGDEWTRFDSQGASKEELDAIFEQYFSIFPWDALPPGAVGADVGAGSGRWAARVAPRAGLLHVIDASRPALDVARQNLANFPNCVFHEASVDAIPLEPSSLDFAYSLGVLHHVPDTMAALESCAKLLKRGAPFLVYLYYALDNRTQGYQLAFKLSNFIRQRVSKLPNGMRYAVTQMLAASVYWPLARAARIGEAAGLDVSGLPLAYYRNRSFYVMRNDALDRFGTPLERRFSRGEIESMLKGVGFRDIAFRDAPPYWCAVGFRR